MERNCGSRCVGMAANDDFNIACLLGGPPPRRGSDRAQDGQHETRRTITESPKLVRRRADWSLFGRPDAPFAIPKHTAQLGQLDDDKRCSAMRG